MVSKKKLERQGRRRAVASVLAGLILFAMLLTVGVGFFLLVNTGTGNLNQASATRQASAQGASQELLTVVPVLQGSNLYVGVTNTGGTASTIKSVFVTLPSGTIVPISGQTFPTGSPALSVNLPLTLLTGESTAIMNCGGNNCNIGILTYPYSTPVLVSVLTADGQVFSAQYPPQQTAVTAVTNVVSVTSVQQQVTTSVTDSVTSTINQQTTQVNCYGCITDLSAGGNILVTEVIAAPSPVQTGATVTAIVTVSNFGPSTAYGVNLYSAVSPYTQLNLAVSNSGTPIVSGPCSPSGSGCSPSGTQCTFVPGFTSTVASGSATEFTCSFTANSEGSGGTVAFSGYATGCLAAGSPPLCSVLTGTTTAGTTSTLLSDSGLAGVTLNSLVGETLTYTSGPASGLSQVITANTASPGVTITTGAFAPVPDSSGDTFKVTGTYVQSATASSNPVQIGNIVSFGPWSANFYYFQYNAVDGTGTTTTGTTSTVLHDTGLQVNGGTPATNSLVGDTLIYTSGPASGQSQVITANTGTTITTAAFSPAPSSSGNTFSVVDSGTPAVIEDTNDYVTLYIQVTNTYDSPMYLLDNSYQQFVSPGSDVNAFMVEPNSISYAGATPTFTAYGCSDTPPGAPTDSVGGQSCIEVMPGQSVTIPFAASSIGGSSWEWGTTNPGGNEVGCTVMVILAFAVQTGSSYTVYAQTIPFQSVYIA